MQGRDLDVTDQSSEVSRDTNYITEDRDNILEKTFSDLEDVKDPRITFSYMVSKLKIREAPDRNGLCFAIRKYN